MRIKVGARKTPPTPTAPHAIPERKATTTYSPYDHIIIGFGLAKNEMDKKVGNILLQLLEKRAAPYSPDLFQAGLLRNDSNVFTGTGLVQNE